MTDFEHYIAPARHRLLRYALTLTRNISAAEDLVQEALLRAVSSGWHGGTFPQFVKWARTTMLHAHIDMREREKVQQKHAETAISFTTAVVTEIGVIVQRDFRNAWEAITEEQRSLITIVALDPDYKLVRPYYQRLHRGRKRLRQYFDEGVPQRAAA